VNTFKYDSSHNWSVTLGEARCNSAPATHRETWAPVSYLLKSCGVSESTANLNEPEWGRMASCGRLLIGLLAMKREPGEVDCHPALLWLVQIPGDLKRSESRQCAAYGSCSAVRPVSRLQWAAASERCNLNQVRSRSGIESRQRVPSRARRASSSSLSQRDKT
jgi:hypothetical protein